MIRLSIYFKDRANLISSRLGVGLREKEVKDYLKVFGLNNYKDKIAINQDGNNCEWSRFLREFNNKQD